MVYHQEFNFDNSRFLTEHKLYAFVNIINNMDPNVKFAIEIEKDNELSFLDVKLIKNLSCLNAQFTGK